MRHGADHIHIVATLVRQDRRTYWARNDYPLAQAACRDIEDRYDLVRVAPPGKGSRSWPKTGELNKNQRRQRSTSNAPRDELRRRVRDAATLAIDEHDFFARLMRRWCRDRAAAGERTQPRRDHRLRGRTWPATPPPLVNRSSTAAARWPPISASSGYANAGSPTPRSQAATDVPANYARPPPRSTNAPPTSSPMPPVTSTPTPPTRPRSPASPPPPRTCSPRLAATWEGGTGGPLTRAAELFDRAAHEPHRTPPAGTGRRGRSLRVIARLLATAGGTGRGREQRELDTMLELVRAIAGLADAIGDIRQAQQRRHQADAARMTATALTAYQPPPDTQVAPAPDRTPTVLGAPTIAPTQPRPDPRRSERRR